MVHQDRGPDAARRVDGIDWKQDDRAAVAAERPVWNNQPNLKHENQRHGGLTGLGSVYDDL